MKVLRSFLLAALPVLLSGCGPDATQPSTVRLATTTSTANSGLLEWLRPELEQSTGVRVHVIAVGTGAALQLGRRGDADIVFVHAREREDEFVRNGFGTDRRDVCWNDFLIVGPPDDPAGIKDVGDPAEALRRIHAAGASFVSRGDDSGTHIREMSFWESADKAPRDNPRYVEAGQGMGACLVIADERRGYALTDRGTWLAFREQLELRPLVEGAVSLRNPYGVILVEPSRHDGIHVGPARAVMDYLTSEQGQKRIASFRKNGEVLFHPARTGNGETE